MKRKLTAILCADVCGYSRLMGQDEEATLRTLTVLQKIIRHLIDEHHGRFVGSAGDSVLAEFASVVNAVQCAIAIQDAVRAENVEVLPERRMEFRIGVNLGDVLVDGEQIYGDGVNVAARLENLAEPGSINISATVHEHVRNKLALRYEDLGEKTVKNITDPVRVFRVLPQGFAPSAKKTHVLRRQHLRRGILSLAGLATIAVVAVLVQHISFEAHHSHALIAAAPKPASPEASRLPLPDKPSIAVLPFDNLSRDPDQEYFSDGITDDLTTGLSRVPGVFVIDRNSAFSYKGKKLPLQQVSKELGVKYVLEGSVRKAAGQIRIGVQLADATTGIDLWAERYDRPLRDVFALQDQIVRKIMTTLNLQLNLVRLGIVIPRSTANFEAYDDLLRGVQYTFTFAADDRKARQMFDKAIALDPAYSAAYAFLGYNYFSEWLFALDPDPQGLERGMQLEQKAIALDQSSAFAHTVLGGIYSQSQFYDKALSEIRRAVGLDPNFAYSQFWLAHALSDTGRAEEGLAAADLAVRLDPRNAPVYAYEQGYAYTQMGRWREATSAFRSFVHRFPDHIWAHAWLAVDYLRLGDLKDAQIEKSHVEQAISAAPDSAVSYVIRAYILIVESKSTDALLALEKAKRLDPRNPYILDTQADAYLLLRRSQDAIPLLKTELADHPADVGARIELAIAYIEMNQDKAALAEAEEILRLNPQLSARSANLLLLGQNSHRIEDLRKVGLK